MKLCLTLTLTLLFASVARAEIQRSGTEEFPGKHELSAHIGYQAGFGQQLGDPSGLKLAAEYGYRFHRIVWFDLQLNNVFGFGARDGFCLNGGNNLCYRGGWSTEIGAGVKLKFPLRVPLVIEVPLLLAVNILYNRECGDNGASFPVGRVGAGVKYFVTRKIGLGAVFNFDFGPMYHASTPCRGTAGTYTDFYGSFDFLLGAEFIL
jgi:hypothetical protein